MFSLFCTHHMENLPMRSSLGWRMAFWYSLYHPLPQTELLTKNFAAQSEFNLAPPPHPAPTGIFWEKSWRSIMILWRGHFYPHTGVLRFFHYAFDQHKWVLLLRRPNVRASRSIVICHGVCDPLINKTTQRRFINLF